MIEKLQEHSNLLKIMERRNSKNKKINQSKNLLIHSRAKKDHKEEKFSQRKGVQINQEIN